MFAPFYGNLAPYIMVNRKDDRRGSPGWGVPPHCRLAFWRILGIKLFLGCGYATGSTRSCVMFNVPSGVTVIRVTQSFILKQTLIIAHIANALFIQISDFSHRNGYLLSIDF